MLLIMERTFIIVVVVVRVLRVGVVIVPRLSLFAMRVGLGVGRVWSAPCRPRALLAAPRPATSAAPTDSTAPAAPTSTAPATYSTH